MICPICKQENDDDWVVKKDGKLLTGVCQMCWEDYCSFEWWEMIEIIGQLVK